ncbi:hypothetical protein [Zavarzinella formosa]|uniref:hypothetical protein n=1 Tax=Zavarzinella formosa TaxID=360055 RepID=UPI0002E8FAC0|nr:hypothetical protein [Zavarzinella formosa]
MRLAGISYLALLLTVSAGMAQTPEMIARVEFDLTMKRLQGVWIPEFQITGDGLEAYPVKGRSLIVSGTEFARLDGGKNVQSGTIALFLGDPGVMDFNITDRIDWDLERANFTPDKLIRKQKTMFKVDGDVLTIAYPVPGRNRPDDLRAAPNRQVVVYKRQVEKIEEPKAEKVPVVTPKTEKIPVVGPKR